MNDTLISLSLVHAINKYEIFIGVADGAGRNILDIIALNVRSELVFGRFSDGCTSLYCGDKEYAYLGQNWDVGQPLIMHYARGAFANTAM